MGKAIVTLKVMPDSPEVDLKQKLEEIKKKVTGFVGEETEFKTKEEPIAFGLKALHVTFVMDENKGATDSLEQDIKKLDNIASVETVDVRRAVE